MDKQEFAVLFRYLSKESGYSDNELAKQLQVQRPTIERWREGVSSPHEVGRKPIIDWLVTKQPVFFAHLDRNRG